MVEGFDGEHGSSTESDEEDPDIDVYEDENDILDDLESDSDHHTSGHPHVLQPSSSQPHGDNVLPGIEDDSMSGDENFSHLQEDDEDDGNASDVSSVPSEYPSRQLQPTGDGREMTHGPEAEDARGVGFSFHGADEGDDGEEEEDDEDGQVPW